MRTKKSAIRRPRHAVARAGHDEQFKILVRLDQRVDDLHRAGRVNILVHFTGLDAGADLAGAFGVGVPGRIDQGKAGQETLQIQAQMTFGRRLAPPMPGPIHARGDQGNGRRIHQMNRAVELPGKSFGGFAADKLGRQIAQMFQDGPE